MTTPFLRWTNAAKAGRNHANPLHDDGFREALKVLEGSPTAEETLRAMKAVRDAIDISCVENMVRASAGGVPYGELAAASGIRQEAICVILHSIRDKKSPQKPQEH